MFDNLFFLSNILICQEHGMGHSMILLYENLGSDHRLISSTKASVAVAKAAAIAG